jgi:hypothetical protein
VVSCMFVVVSTLCLIVSTLPMFQQKDHNGIARESYLMFILLNIFIFHLFSVAQSWIVRGKDDRCHSNRITAPYLRFWHNSTVYFLCLANYIWFYWLELFSFSAGNIGQFVCFVLCADFVFCDFPLYFDVFKGMGSRDKIQKFRQKWIG